MAEFNEIERKIAEELPLRDKRATLLRVYDDAGNWQGSILLRDLVLMAANMARESMGQKPLKFE